jgi:hypothetical protein
MELMWYWLIVYIIKNVRNVEHIQISNACPKSLFIILQPLSRRSVVFFFFLFFIFISFSFIYIYLLILAYCRCSLYACVHHIYLALENEKVKGKKNERWFAVSNAFFLLSLFCPLCVIYYCI